MADLEAVISVNGKSSDSGAPVPLVLGQSGTISVRLRSQHEISCSAVRLNLAWRTRGRGETDRGTAGTLEKAVERIDAMRPVEIDLPFQIAAQGPVSYKGKAVTFEWSLQIELARPWKRNLALEFPVAVSPEL